MIRIKRIRRRREKAGPIGCLEAQKMIEPYLEGNLSDEEMRRFIEHIDGCPECHEELEIFYTVYEALEDDEETIRETVSLDETIRRSKSRLSRLQTARKVRIGVFLTAFSLAFLVILGMIFPSMLLSPRNMGTLVRNLFTRQQNVIETESEVPDIESVIEDLSMESELDSEAEALIKLIETEEPEI